MLLVIKAKFYRLISSPGILLTFKIYNFIDNLYKKNSINKSFNNRSFEPFNYFHKEVPQVLD
jgi:hypothetical protein